MTTIFRPPAHEHPLLPRELSENYFVRCRRCRHPICGPTLCCLDCNVFFHEWCTEWPLQIQHPCHPQHPLILVTDKYFNSNYCCHRCRFSARADDLVSTLPLTGEKAEKAETIIEHFAHVDHPLASFSVTTPNNIRCGACRQEISGQVYGCCQCMYLLHESCAQLPKEIVQHPFHPRHRLVLTAHSNKRFKCNACGLSYQFAYCCNECQFNLDVHCAFSAVPPEDQEKEVSSMVNHFSHPHPLKSFNIREENKHMTCKACEQHVTGRVYGCPDCTFFLHKSCVELGKELSHFLHEDHRLILSAGGLLNDGSFICNCCSEASSSFTYNCDRCDFNLDIECALKTRSALNDGVNARVQHFAHEHILTLHYLKGYNSPGCNACKQPAQGLAYCCLTCGDFSLHLSCFQLPSRLEHEFHPSHPVILLKMASDNYVCCDACRRKCTGFAFQCAQCTFHLDVECASKKLTLKHPRHEHSLSYLKKAVGLQCYACGRSCNADLYRCVSCDFNLHHDCVPLPPTIKDEHYHSHPLALTREKIVDKYFKEYGEAYCDICERMRNVDLGVYRCEECRLFAHIDCVVPPLLPGKEKLVKNTRLSMLNEEIASAKEEMEAMKTQLEALLKRRSDIDSRVVRGAST